MAKNDKPEDKAAAAEQPEAAAAEAPAADGAAEQAAEEEAAEEVPQAPLHTAYLDHDDPNASANHGGVDIVRGDNGLFLAPLAFVEELVAHGFRVVSEGK